MRNIVRKLLFLLYNQQKKVEDWVIMNRKDKIFHKSCKSVNTLWIKEQHGYNCYECGTKIPDCVIFQWKLLNGK